MYPSTFRNLKSNSKLLTTAKTPSNSAWSRSVGRNSVAPATNNARATRSAIQNNASRPIIMSSSANATRKSNITSAPASKCKFTDRKILTPKQTRSMALEPIRRPYPAVNKPVQVKHAATAVPNLSERKRTVQQHAGNSSARSRLWHRSNKEIIPKLDKSTDIENERYVHEMSIQTNELEILNSELIIGDVKYMLPSQSLVYRIDYERNEARKRELLKARRKFQEHDKKEEEHLTDLQEFLDKAVITKRPQRHTQNVRPTLDMDRKLIKSMDELLNRAVPKTESITDIKGRIKRKEQELLNLFETIENFKI